MTLADAQIAAGFTPKQRAILRAMLENGGPMTDVEIGRAVGGDPASARSRRVELTQREIVILQSEGTRGGGTRAIANKWVVNATKLASARSEEQQLAHFAKIVAIIRGVLSNRIRSRRSIVDLRALFTHIDDESFEWRSWL